MKLNFYFPWTLAVLLLGLFVSPLCWASPNPVRVQVLSRHPMKNAAVSSTQSPLMILSDGDSQKKLRWDKKEPLYLEAGLHGIKLPQVSSSSFTILQFSVGPKALIKISKDGKELSFRGPIRVGARGGKLFFTEDLPLESYVKRVLASEMPTHFPFGALKAQAILIRSFALGQRDRHASEGFNFCDLTHCQVYGSGKRLPDKIKVAADQTRGLILKYRDETIEALYHSTCGGHTSPNQRVFGGRPLPYLQGIGDKNYCVASPHYRWDSTLTLQSIGDSLGQSIPSASAKELKTLEIVDREISQGRVFQLALVGEEREIIPAQKFLLKLGRVLGWSQIKSAWFDLEVQGKEVHFQGRGLGHGVGLCQWGAKGMAEAGHDYPEILAHYFPGTVLQKMRNRP